MAFTCLQHFRSTHPGAIIAPRKIDYSTLRRMSATEAEKGVYVVVVTGKLKPGQLPQFVENFKPLAEHVEKNEEGALTYQLSTGGDDPDRLCIYERLVHVPAMRMWP